MVPRDLLQRLIRYPVYIICLGDPGQLPPINKDDDNHLLDNPHIFLDEIMRQEAESEIIQLTMDIRAGKSLSRFQGKEVQILNRNELTTGMLLWADQILCATNSTRVSLNNQIRELLGRADKPEDGDKVICLKNNWEIYSENGDPLVNGTIGYLKNSFSTFLNIPYNLSSDRQPKRINILTANFISDTNEDYGSINMDEQLILIGESSLDWKTTYKMRRDGKYKPLVPEEFTYGYAITCHKSQGSEWDNVLVIEEGFPYNKEEHKRWLYTACTRAAKKLVIIKKD